MLATVAVAAALLSAAAEPPTGRTCDDGPKRKLVEIKGGYHELAAAVNATRDDFEKVEVGYVQLWAHDGHRRALRSAGYQYVDAEDESAINFAAEKKAAYRHVRGAEPNWGQYCDYNCLTERVAELAASGGCEFPLQLESIGKTVNGRDIWAIGVGVNGPEVLMNANIHGDETTGGQLLQRWLWETCKQADKKQTEVALNARVWYIPMFNADGFENNRRCNANGYDLNRNFPRVTGGGAQLQPEAEALMAFEKKHSFSVGLMMHGGAVVCNTAYDNCYTESIVPRPCPSARPTMHARAAGVEPSSKAYCDPMLAAGARCTVGSGCQVNGASWYQTTGSLQDWEFHFGNTLSMTMEISSTKRVQGSQLPGFYTTNHEALYAFIMWPVHNPNV